MRTDRRTDGRDEINSRFRDSANSPKRNGSRLGVSVSNTCNKNTQVTPCISNLFNDDVLPANTRSFK
jgi:hypothetical protein